MAPGKERVRLDLLLVDRGLAESRSRAQWLIRQGKVWCAGQICRRPGRRFPSNIPLEVEDPLPYVSRGGLKLAYALDRFGIDVRGWVVLDVGASTGGFTDCLLQRGARKVYAVDVGTDQLHPRLCGDERVLSLEQTDIRDLGELPGGMRVDLAVVDVSFISLRLVLPALGSFLLPGGQVVTLIKPQFEAGPGAVNRRGVVRREEDRRRALDLVLARAEALGFFLQGLCAAPADEARGNVEYLAHLRRQGPGVPRGEAIEQVI